MVDIVNGLEIHKVSRARSLSLTAISGILEMLLFSRIPRAERAETNSGEEKIENFALQILNHF
jgi:hypothetical protein